MRLRAWRKPAALVCALACATTPIAGCGAGSAPPIAPSELAAAKTFPYYTTYWVGPTFHGHPVTAADGVAGYKPSVGDSVYYGDCLRSKGILAGGGCLLPLQVTTAIYTPRPNFTLGRQHNVLIRGVPAAVYDEGRAIELYTGRLAIDLFSDSDRDAQAAARLLRPLNRPGSDRRPLPAPVFCPPLEGPRTPAVRHAMEHLPGMACQRAATALAYQQALEGEGGG